MQIRSLAGLALTAALGLGMTGCQLLPLTGAKEAKTLAPSWPQATPPLANNPELEARIQSMLAQMSLPQKVAQMIQADIGSVTEQDIRQYRIGSVLNGGGQTPGNNPAASASEWAEFADRLFRASMDEESDRLAIPLFWGVDAVHGHGNVRGATLFPHNIALGASRNGELVRAIGAATAKEVAATGLDWTFAPTVAVALDARWGRTYESFSEDPHLVAELAAQAVLGLQGEPQSNRFLDQDHIIATAKHFIGDGGTRFGDDQGETQGSEQELIARHLPGYVSAIEAGVQTIMASYTWWNNVHSHANKRLLTDLLKNHLGFDGLVVSDWQAIGHIEGCAIDSCAAAVNAGIDLFMIPNAPDWQNFLRNTVAQVEDGTIPQARIDDAVSRILRVKLRADLWNKPAPASRALAGKNALIGSKVHRYIARQAVRESLVLLKNDGVLPLNPEQRILVAGPGADSIAMQSGGWSVTWRGNNNPNQAYPGATSILAGIKQAVEPRGGKVIYNQAGQTEAKVDAAIVVFGEQPYAEMYGDLQNLATLEFEQNDKQALALLRKLRARGIPVVAVFLSGRPLWVNKELNAANAFVAAWQPGTEGAGVADLLFAGIDGTPVFDFTGKLSFSWPAKPCQTGLNRFNDEYQPLFAFGYGLSYADGAVDWQPQSEDTSAWAYGCHLGATRPESETVTFSADEGWQFYVERKTLQKSPLAEADASMGAVYLTPQFEDFGVQAKWDGSELGRVSLRNGRRDNNLLAVYANEGALVADVEILEAPSAKVEIGVFSGALTASFVDITEALRDLPMGVRQSLSIDLRCFTRDRADLVKLDAPFSVQTSGTLLASFSNIHYQPGLAERASVSCP